jgi:hypothetical protein
MAWDPRYKSYLAGAAIGANRIVKFGSDDDHVVLGAAATDSLIGVSGNIAAGAAEERIDVVKEGIADVVAGGSITRGGLVTSDAAGAAVAAAPSAGANNRIIGIAEASAASGDIFPVMICPGSVQG